MAELKFEQALSKLEKIVEEMESDQLSLEDSLKRYEEGMKLSRLCSTKLKEAEKKIEILIKDSQGNLKAETFESDAIEELPETKKTPPKSSSKPQPVDEDDDEDLLF